MQDLRLSQSGDLLISNYQISLTNGIDYIEQKLKTTLRLFLGEWFADVGQGIAYYENILIKNYNAQLVQSTLVDAILSVPGVNEIIAFDINLDGRKITVTFTVNTDLGELTINEELS